MCAEHLRNALRGSQFGVMALPVIHAQRIAGKTLSLRHGSMVAESSPPDKSTTAFFIINILKRLMSWDVVPQQLVAIAATS